MHPLAQFLDSFRNACATGHFLKCTLGKPTATAPEGLKNIYLRPVALKAGPRIAFTYRYRTRDEVKNFSAEEASLQLEALLGIQYLNADLFIA